MTRFVRLAVLAAMAGTFVSAESLDDILGRMDQAARNFRTFSAKIKRTEYTQILHSSDVTDGAQRVMKLRGQPVTILEFFGQNPQTIRLSGRSAEVYYPNAKLVEVWDAGKYARAANQMLLLGFGTSGAELRKDYELTVGGSETIGTARTTRIELVPKDRDLKKQVEKIEMWIPEGESNPVQVKVNRTSKDYELASYSDVKLNPALPESDFDLKLPSDVRRKVMK
jgi:outer membrane lipoprotein-sorting protein